MKTGTVTIHGITWNIQLAETQADIAAGLNNLTSLAPNTGMLFDVGGAVGKLANPQINMDNMLFSIDVFGIREEIRYTGQQISDNVYETVNQVNWAVAPSQKGIWFSEVRYYLEVNAGEASALLDSDNVVFDDVLRTYLHSRTQTAVNNVSILSFIPWLLIFMMIAIIMKDSKKSKRK